VKGLYRRALEGSLKTLPGLQTPYEEPTNPEIIVDTDRLRPEEAVEAVLEGLKRLRFLG